eukprot:gene39295-53118_t
MATFAGLRLLAAPLTLANFAVFGWVLGLGRAGAGLALQTILNGTNIALTLLFVGRFGWGIGGAATATILADAVTLAVALGMARISPAERRALSLRSLFEIRALTAMLTLNRDIMIRSFVLLAAFALFSRASAIQGEVVLAANGILENLFMFGAYFLDGMAAAVETFVGRAIGARDGRMFAAAVRLTTLWGFGLAALIGTGMLAGGATLVGWMTSDPQVGAMTVAYLPYAALTPLAGVLAFQMDGVFIGATWSADMRNMMLLSLVLFVAALYGLMPAFGNAGLWTAFLIFLGARGVSLWLIQRKRAANAFASVRPIG